MPVLLHQASATVQLYTVTRAPPPLRPSRLQRACLQGHRTHQGLVQLRESARELAHERVHAQQEAEDWAGGDMRVLACFTLQRARDPAVQVCCTQSQTEPREGPLRVCETTRVRPLPVASPRYCCCTLTLCPVLRCRCSTATCLGLAARTSPPALRCPATSGESRSTLCASPTACVSCPAAGSSGSSGTRPASGWLCTSSLLGTAQQYTALESASLSLCEQRYSPHSQNQV